MFSRRHLPGLSPSAERSMRVKWVGAAKAQRGLISASGRRESRRSSQTRSMRLARSQRCGVCRAALEGSRQVAAGHAALARDLVQGRRAVET